MENRRVLGADKDEYRRPQRPSGPESDHDDKDRQKPPGPAPVSIAEECLGDETAIELEKGQEIERGDQKSPPRRPGHGVQEDIL